MFVIYFAHKQSQVAAHCEVFCECIYNRSQPHISLNQQACLEIFMTWMFRLLFSQPSPGEAAFLIAPEEIRHMLSKGSLKLVKNRWKHGFDGWVNWGLANAVLSTKFPEQGEWECSTPSIWSQRQHSSPRHPSRHRAVTSPFCCRSWETTLALDVSPIKTSLSVCTASRLTLCQSQGGCCPPLTQASLDASELELCVR